MSLKFASTTKLPYQLLLQTRVLSQHGGQKRVCSLCDHSYIHSRHMHTPSQRKFRSNISEVKIQKCNFSSDPDDLKNDKIIKEWMSEIMENFERAEKLKAEKINKRAQKGESVANTDNSDLDNIEKEGFTTDEYLKMLREKGFTETTDKDINDDVTDSSSEFDSDNETNVGKKSQSSDKTPNDHVADSKETSKDFSKMESDDWSVVVLNEYNEVDETEPESYKQTHKPVEKFSKKKQVDTSEDSLEWSEMEIEDFVNIAPPEADMEDTWVPPISLTSKSLRLLGITNGGVVLIKKH